MVPGGTVEEHYKIRPWLTADVNLEVRCKAKLTPQELLGSHLRRRSRNPDRTWKETRGFPRKQSVFRRGRRPLPCELRQQSWNGLRKGIGCWAAGFEICTPIVGGMTEPWSIATSANDRQRPTSRTSGAIPSRSTLRSSHA